jgi:hypothetical protein
LSWSSFLSQRSQRHFSTHLIDPILIAGAERGWNLINRRSRSLEEERIVMVNWLALTERRDKETAAQSDRPLDSRPRCLIVVHVPYFVDLGLGLVVGDSKLKKEGRYPKRPEQRSVLQCRLGSLDSISRPFEGPRTTLLL